MTSPPYFGLRDYGVTGQLGLEARHDCLGWATRVDCGSCYVCALRAVFREIWRVIKADGVAWLNLGDSYATSAGGVGQSPGGGKQGEAWRMRSVLTPPNRMPLAGLKPKDLILIPHRVALALQADGWWVRNDIVWSKPNGMPHPATDRVVSSHEYVFLLAKSKRYYFDHLAIRNPPSPSFLKEIADGYVGQATKDYASAGAQDPSAVKSRIIRRARGKTGTTHRELAGRTSEGVSLSGIGEHLLGSNARSVWHIASANYRGDHYAVMPAALARRCILAGSRPGDVVLDPFGGTGTTASEAIRVGRRALMVDIDRKCMRLSAARLSETPVGLGLGDETESEVR